MGTNYYFHQKPPCECCGRPFERLHIGKSSAGWCFSLHVDPEIGVRDLPDWVERWSQPGTYIADECGDLVTPEEMYLCITERRSKGPRWPAYMHAANDSLPGPSGLVRHQADGRLCIGHGAGTWDLMAGEFS